MSDATAPRAQPALLRTMGLVSLVLYGVGDMLGAGIYGLVGKAAGQLGNAVWLGFVAAMCAALLTGLSYASLGSRYPRAAGVAFVADRAFGLPFLSYAVGLATLASALTSMATASRIFAGYWQGFGHAVPAGAIALVFIAVLTVVNFWGIRESLWLNLVCTAVEAGGLLTILVVSLPYWGSVDYLAGPTGTLPGVALVLQGAVLVFFSFVGFEDMLNVTEEVREPERTFPLALVIALLVTTAIYVAIGIGAVSVVPHAELARSGQPLVDVVHRAAPWFPPGVFRVISLFAVTNTALLNYVMSARLLYGMANQGLLPAFLGRVHPRRRTPHAAIGVLMIVVSGLALAGDVSVLAKSTALLLLGVFLVVNIALFVLQRRPDEPPGRFEIPAAVPLAGAAVCAILIAHAKAGEVAVASGVGAVIVLLYALMRAGKRASA